MKNTLSFYCNFSYTHSECLIFNIKPILLSALFILHYLQIQTVESISVFIIIFSHFFSFFQCDILDIDASGWLNVIKQIKQAQPVLNMENSGHCAYCKLLKVKPKNGFEGYLILTGARSQLTTLIKPQYIALPMSGNPRFQYYSKLEWCFLRC